MFQLGLSYSPMSKTMPTLRAIQPARVRFGTDQPPAKPGQAKSFPPEKFPETLAEVAKLLKNLAFMRTQDYRDGVKKAYNEAKNHLKDYLKAGGDPTQAAVVMDLDETVLDNSSNYLERLTAKVPKRLSYFKWMQSANAPAIPEAIDFINYARRNKFRLFFTTGRKQNMREATVTNLTRIGLSPKRYDGLYLKPADYAHDSMNNYKVQAQQEIEKLRYKVVLVIGDQDSDVQGALGKAVKLPTNYLYEVE